MPAVYSEQIPALDSVRPTCPGGLPQPSRAAGVDGVPELPPSPFATTARACAPELS
jgi:hypothetical protein